MKLRFAVALLAVAGCACIAVQANAPVDISGTWLFSVDLDTGGHGDPTFIFKQDKDVLTGSYDGPLGQYSITGTVDGNRAIFGFEFTNEDQKYKVTYTGTVESATRMSGTMEIAGGPRGKWSATRK